MPIPRSTNSSPLPPDPQPSPRHRRSFARTILLTVVAVALSTVASAETKPVTTKRLLAADAEAGNWLTYGRTYDEQRHSPLSQIGLDNIDKLSLAWSYEIGTLRGIETTPLIVDGILYGTGSWSIVFALDAATGRELWRYDPEVPKWKGRNACCDVVNRGVATLDGKLFVGTIDGRLIALDAETGTPILDVQNTDPSKAYTITGAPRVVKGMVIIGNGGADLGVRGYFSAYEAETGKLVWRFYTVPGSSEGPHESPALERAAKTWSKDTMWEAGGGGTAWDAFAYDPELDLLYAGVGNGAIFDRAVRSPGGGDNLYLASILALRPDTGELVWHYQTTPGETWDYTAVQQMILADIELKGRTRKVLMQAPKNGFFYVLDRETGELLSAEKIAFVSWASHVDLETGRPVERPEADWSNKRAFVTPGPPGAHNWHPMSYSPRTGLVYIPTSTTVQPFQPDPGFKFRPGTNNIAVDLAGILEEREGFIGAMKVCDPSHITAWDPVSQTLAWKVNHESRTPGGILTTASDLLFQGSGTTFTAYDARSGERVWKSEVGVGMMAPPISYLANGEQYVVVSTGIGGVHGALLERLTYINDGRVLAYKIGGKAKMPAAQPRAPGSVHITRKRPSAESVREGRRLYFNTCLWCHGGAAISSGEIPDLRHSSAQVHADWQNIVIGGTRQGKGMASFADVLTPEQADQIHDYVVYRALHDPNLIERLAKWVGGYTCIPADWLAD